MSSSRDFGFAKTLSGNGAIDFVHDKLSNGKPYKMLTVLDEYTRQALCVEVNRTMGADDVLDALYRLLIKHGKPEYIRSDNGPEFIAGALQDWLKRPSRQIALQSPAGSVQPLARRLRLDSGPMRKL